MSPFIPGSYKDKPVAECRKAVAEIMTGSWRVPARFGLSARAMKVTEALERIEAAADTIYTAGQLCLLCGPPGTGKSFAGYALACLGYLRHGYDFSGYQAQTLFQMAWQDDRKAEYNDAWQRSATLLIDDLGAEPLSKSGAIDANLYEGLNHRYSQALPTILTTNFKALELANLYPNFADRLKSRFKEWAVIIEIRGNDMRADAAILDAERGRTE